MISWGGGETTGYIGALGWAAGGTGVTLRTIAAESGRPGIFELYLAGAAGNLGAAFLPTGGGVPAAGHLHSSDTFAITWILRPTINSSAVLLRAGLLANTTETTDPPAAGIYFEKCNDAVTADCAAADTNWWAVTKTAGGRDTRINTGVATTANTWARLQIRRVDANTIGFSVNGGALNCITTVASAPAVCTGANVLNALYIPAAGTEGWAFVKINDATITKLDLDYYDALITGLNR